MSHGAIISAPKEPPLSPGRAAAEAFVDLVKSPFGQVGIEPSAERRREEIVQKLLKLELTNALREKLLPHLTAAGFRLLNGCRAEHPYGTPAYWYTGLQSDSTEVALIQLPPGVFAKTESGHLYVSDFAYMLKAFRGRTIRWFSKGLEGTRFAFKTAFDDEKRGSNWSFTEWSSVVDLGEGNLTVWQAFSLPKSGPVSSLPKAISDDQLKSIVDVLQRYVIFKGDAAQTFRVLVSESGWPTEWKTDRLTAFSIKPPDARGFVDYMMQMKTFPAGHNLAGRSVLGEFLRQFVKEAGGEDRDRLARIVVGCTLLPDADTFTEYYLP